MKTAIKLYANEDPTMRMVREFEEKCERTGRRSLKKDTERYASERGLYLKLSYPCPTANTEEGEELPGEKVGVMMRIKEEESRTEEVRQQKWQGKLIEARWDDADVIGCFSWLCRWKTAPTHTVAGVYELYQQLLPTKIYQQYKTKTSNNTDVKCRMCGKAMESVPHVLSGCSALAQSKYKTRHDAALKVLFFDLLCDMGLIESAPSWCSPETPKPEYKNDRASAFWDVPVYAEKTEVRANRIDARVVDKHKKVVLLETSCLWMANRKQNEEENTSKYALLGWEIRQQYPHYILLSSNFMWAEHVEHVISKVNQRLRHLLPYNAHLLYYKSLVLPIFDYANMVWDDKDNAVLMNNLQVLQNKVAKLVLDKPLYSSATDALNQLGWLNLKQRRHFHRCLYVYKCVNGITSHKLELSRNSDVHRYNTRCKDHLSLSSVKRNWGKQRTFYHAFKDWNSLDSDLKNSGTICQFRDNFFKSFNL